MFHNKTAAFKVHHEIFSVVLQNVLSTFITVRYGMMSLNSILFMI